MGIFRSRDGRHNDEHIPKMSNVHLGHFSKHLLHASDATHIQGKIPRQGEKDPVRARGEKKGKGVNSGKTNFGETFLGLS